MKDHQLWYLVLKTMLSRPNAEMDDIYRGVVQALEISISRNMFMGYIQELSDEGLISANGSVPPRLYSVTCKGEGWAIGFKHNLLV